jgi:uncharacterized protein YgfB (UPF0149 family)
VAAAPEEAFMDAQRRSLISKVGAALLPELEEVVTESWNDLMPAAAHWGPVATQRAKRATAAALRGLLAAYEQGDLDDRSWELLRRDVLGRGYATAHEAEDLLRTVRIVGVELLTERLSHYIGLTHDERWLLQREASTFCERLLGGREEVDAEALDSLLAELERSGPDLT